MIRDRVFWILDYLKGSKVKKHLVDIKYINENGQYADKKSKQHLEKLLKYVTTHVEAYENYSNYKDIKDFPIKSKKEIVEDGEKAFSKSFDREKLYQMSTSGTSGAPFVSYQNKNKKLRVRAALIYYGELCNFFIGERNVYLRFWNQSHHRNKIGCFMKNMIPIDIHGLTPGKLENIRGKLLKDKKVKCILGYGSTYEIMADYLLEKNDKPTNYCVKTIISGAVYIKNTTREKLVKIFGCDVVSRYSNQENGTFSQEPIGESFSILNKACYHFEFLKIGSDEAADFGELSRVIVTDLFNYAMPLIRYDTKDIAIIERHEKYGVVMSKLFGRRDDAIFDTNGIHIYENTFEDFISKKLDLGQYQVVQKSKEDYLIRVKNKKNVSSNEEVIKVFKEMIGGPCNVRVEIDPSLAPSKSGKFQILISEYLPEVSHESFTKSDGPF